MKKEAENYLENNERFLKKIKRLRTSTFVVEMCCLFSAGLIFALLLNLLPIMGPYPMPMTLSLISLIFILLLMASLYIRHLLKHAAENFINDEIEIYDRALNALSSGYTSQHEAISERISLLISYRANDEELMQRLLDCLQESNFNYLYPEKIGEIKLWTDNNLLAPIRTEINNYIAVTKQNGPGSQAEQKRLVLHNRFKEIEESVIDNAIYKLNYWKKKLAS
jgi:hypothetical protein